LPIIFLLRYSAELPNGGTDRYLRHRVEQIRQVTNLLGIQAGKPMFQNQCRVDTIAALTKP
jgi:hypothetical protein